MWKSNVLRGLLYKILRQMWIKLQKIIKIYDFHFKDNCQWIKKLTDKMYDIYINNQLDENKLIEDKDILDNEDDLG